MPKENSIFIILANVYIKNIEINLRYYSLRSDNSIAFIGTSWFQYESILMWFLREIRIDND